MRMCMSQTTYNKTSNKDLHQTLCLPLKKLVFRACSILLLYIQICFPPSRGLIRASDLSVTPLIPEQPSFTEASHLSLKLLTLSKIWKITRSIDIIKPYFYLFNLPNYLSSRQVKYYKMIRKYLSSKISRDTRFFFNYVKVCKSFVFGLLRV